MAAASLGLPRLMLAMLVLVPLLGVGVDGRNHVHKKPPRAGVSSPHRAGAKVGTVASSPAVPPDDDATPLAPPPGGIVPSDPATPFRPEPCVFDVRAYGATGESTADDTEAFRAAWRAACAVESAVLLVPSDGTFTISTTTFSGPCKPGLVFQWEARLDERGLCHCYPSPSSSPRSHLSRSHHEATRRAERTATRI
ncbi:unnamed protein product [Triticum turgidum subsp. durum]|uniref:Polygalacturonase n=1 Tax=Triticum turgidum subsp. durum TaxID=4567 RepID=A0A9R1C1B4_TRITD|nr:unnamed protein product [Triticum turgidum subsp. durum]